MSNYVICDLCGKVFLKGCPHVCTPGKPYVGLQQCLNETPDPRDTQIAELTAERDMLAKALQDAPILSKFHGDRGFDVDGFIVAYDAWRAKARVALAQKQAPTAQEVREGLR